MPDKYPRMIFLQGYKGFFNAFAVRDSYYRVDSPENEEQVRKYHSDRLVKDLANDREMMGHYAG